MDVQDSAERTIQPLHPREPRPDSARRQRWLVCVDSHDPAAIGLRLPLDGSPYTFGRGRRTTHFIDDPVMSRGHFKLAPSDGDYVVTDLGAANGTHVDGRPLSKEGSSPVRDVIRAGETLFVVDEEPDLDTLPAHPSQSEEHLEGVVGASRATGRLRASIRTVANTRLQRPVMLLGATGTGKEVTAKAIHEASGRSGPFLPVNMAAIPQNLFEAELFGYRKNAFTGADRDYDGLIVQADGGTLFLDEIGELDPRLQPKLLRVMEDLLVTPLHAPPSSGRKVDVRVVTATNRDLSDGGFRRDLRARLNTWVLELPPLRRRRADILPLAWHFLDASPSEATTAFKEALLLYSWPDNVRELRDIMLVARELRGDDELFSTSILSRSVMGDSARPEPDTGQEPVISRSRITGGPTREQLHDALVKYEGNISLIAAHFKVWRNQIYRKAEQYGFEPRAFRKKKR